MFDRFGEIGSAEGINRAAAGLREEGDLEGLRALAEENGIYDPDIMGAFVAGDIPFLCDEMSAAIGKIDVECKSVGCAEILEDWAAYIRARCMEDPEVARAVRRKGKSLSGCIAELLGWGFRHQHEVDRAIMEAAGVRAGRCTLGIPGMATAKKIITGYYLGGGRA
ncbi:MAG: hypothetical protein NC331_11455 [Lachnospiraceae bacterium]|nr:hypothetical protein [Lachnospiraceae bacterium]MCM1239984.1 hypothetical protein [Lachnospiraceae bacterium]